MASISEQFVALNLSPEEMESYQKKFKAFDLDKDGILSIREFAAMSKVFGYKLSKEEIMVSSLISFLTYLINRNSQLNGFRFV